MDQGIWIIRNYYNLQTKAFATNSYLVDYDPDLLAALAGASGDQVLADGARRSYEVVLRAMSPAGLIHTVIQPELATLTDKKLAFFSPNDVVKLANACTVAERSLGEARRAGQELLKLVLARLPDVREYYLGASGEPVPGAKAAGPAARACLVRLAANMKDRGALDRLWPVLLAKLPDCCTAAGRQQLDPYLTSEVGLALDRVARMNGLSR